MNAEARIQNRSHIQCWSAFFQCPHVTQYCTPLFPILQVPKSSVFISNYVPKSRACYSFQDRQPFRVPNHESAYKKFMKLASREIDFFRAPFSVTSCFHKVLFVSLRVLFSTGIMACITFSTGSTNGYGMECFKKWDHIFIPSKSERYVGLKTQGPLYVYITDFQRGLGLLSIFRGWNPALVYIH